MSKQIDPQAAIETMWKLIPELSKAKGELTYMEEYSKSLKAILMKASGQQSAAAQEREALADQQYIQHLAGLQAATERFEAMRWKMVVTQTAIDTWRTQEASNRAIDRATT